MDLEPFQRDWHRHVDGSAVRLGSACIAGAKTGKFRKCVPVLLQGRAVLKARTVRIWWSFGYPFAGAAEFTGSVAGLLGEPKMIL